MEEREKDINAILEETRQLRVTKGHDYSPGDDIMANLRTWGSLGVLVRINDKISRLNAFYRQGTLACKDESVEDTMLDTINYSLFLLIMRRQEKELKKATKGAANADRKRAFDRAAQA